MSTLSELAAEYRVSAAKLAMRIAELEAGGTEPGRLRKLRRMLDEVRQAQRAISGYYALPRTDEHLTCVHWHGRGPTRDDH